ncbi:MAG: hypothetical protein RL154_1184 [Pseudomonadota bacterium]|jgi:uncharacterized protein (TIGR00251 family)
MNCYKITDDGIRLFIKASPNASKSEVVGFFEDSIKIKIAAHPIDGKANEELIKFLSKTLKIAKSDIKIVSGDSSKIKCLLLPLKLEEKIKGLIDGINR